MLNPRLWALCYGTVILIVLILCPILGPKFQHRAQEIFFLLLLSYMAMYLWGYFTAVFFVFGFGMGSSDYFTPKVEVVSSIKDRRKLSIPNFILIDYTGPNNNNEEVKAARIALFRIMTVKKITANTSNLLPLGLTNSEQHHNPLFNQNEYK